MFSGFSPETFDFLWGIRMNNHRDWFLPHKQQYVQTLYEPMKALGEQLFQPFWDKPGNVLRVSRIYRDARLHPPEPYKDSLWLSIRWEGEWWGENPCLYFDIRPEGVSYGFGLWQPKPGTMEAFRRALDREPEAFLRLIRDTEAQTGRPVTAQCYRRPPQPRDPRLAPYFAWRGNVSCVRQEPPGPALFTPELGTQVGEMFRQLMPLYEFFCRLCGDPNG